MAYFARPFYCKTMNLHLCNRITNRSYDKQWLWMIGHYIHNNMTMPLLFVDVIAWYDGLYLTIYIASTFPQVKYPDSMFQFLEPHILTNIASYVAQSGSRSVNVKELLPLSLTCSTLLDAARTVYMKQITFDAMRQPSSLLPMYHHDYSCLSYTSKIIIIGRLRQGEWERLQFLHTFIPVVNSITISNTSLVYSLPRVVLSIFRNASTVRLVNCRLGEDILRFLSQCDLDEYVLQDIRLSRVVRPTSGPFSPGRARNLAIWSFNNNDSLLHNQFQTGTSTSAVKNVMISVSARGFPQWLHGMASSLSSIMIDFRGKGNVQRKYKTN